MMQQLPDFGEGADFAAACLRMPGVGADLDKLDAVFFEARSL